MIEKQTRPEIRDDARKLADSTPLTQYESYQAWKDDYDLSVKLYHSRQFDRALEIGQRVVGKLDLEALPNDTRLTRSLQFLAAAYEGYGQIDMAASTLDRLITTVNKGTREASSTLLPLYEQSGTLWLTVGNGGKAIERLEIVRTMLREGDRKSSNTAIFNNLILCSLAHELNGDIGRYQGTMQEAFSQMTSGGAIDLNSVMPVVNRAASILLMRHRPADAEAVLSVGQSILTKEWDSKSLTQVLTFEYLVAAKSMLGKREEVLDLVNTHMKTAETAFGPDSDKVDRLRTAFSKLLRQCGYQDESAKLIQKRAVEIVKRSADGADPKLFPIYMETAWSNFYSGFLADSNTFLDFARRCRVPEAGVEKAELARLEASLALMKYDNEEAIQYFKGGLSINEGVPASQTKILYKAKVGLQLVNTLIRTEKFEESQKLLNDLLPSLDDIDSDFERTYVNQQFFSQRGNLAFCRSEFGEALKAYEKALQFSRYPILSGTGSLAMCLLDLASLQLATEDYQAASKNAEEAWPIVENGTALSKLLMPRALKILAVARSANGDNSGSQEMERKLSALKFELGMINDGFPLPML